NGFVLSAQKGFCSLLDGIGDRTHGVCSGAFLQDEPRQEKGEDKTEDADPKGQNKHRPTFLMAAGEGAAGSEPQGDPPELHCVKGKSAEKGLPPRPIQ